MKAPGKLCSLATTRGMLYALDTNGCLWVKQAIQWDWDRVETPHEQWVRKQPGHIKRRAKR